MTTTAVKERPILFSAPMVRAILDGRKTQTRRIVKFNHKPSWLNPLEHVVYADDGWPIWFDSPPSDSLRKADPAYFEHGYPCPHGGPGDRLWVRETWAPRIDVDPIADPEKAFHYCMYKAEGGDPADEMNWHDYGGKWRPSIHMPRWASRLMLEITDVRVQRLLDISEDDARAEGVPQNLMASTHKIGFENLWNSIHGCNAHKANPWVWAITFRRVEGLDA